MIRRMMLIEASCPSNRADAVTMRTGCSGTCRSGVEVVGVVGCAAMEIPFVAFSRY